MVSTRSGGIDQGLIEQVGGFLGDRGGEGSGFLGVAGFRILQRAKIPGAFGGFQDRGDGLGGGDRGDFLLGRGKLVGEQRYTPLPGGSGRGSGSPD